MSWARPLTRRKAQRWRLRYAEGPTNAESLAVSPNGVAYVVTKSFLGTSIVYRLPPKEFPQLRALATASYDRSYYPAGVPRQLAAMILDGSRADALLTLDTPTLVIHGRDDSLIDPSGGRRTAELVPGAKFLLVEDMGHDRPQELWQTLIDAIAEHTQGGTRA